MFTTEKYILHVKNRNFFEQIGISFEAGAHWKPLRKLFNPMFNLKILQSFIPIFNEKTKKFVEELEKEVGNQRGFDIKHHAFHSTLDAICSEYEYFSHFKCFNMSVLCLCILMDFFFSCSHYIRSRYWLKFK